MAKAVLGCLFAVFLPSFIKSIVLHEPFCMTEIIAKYYYLTIVARGSKLSVRSPNVSSL